MPLCCVANKDAKGGGNEISSEMKEIKVEKFDSLFAKGKDALDNAEALRAGIQDSKDACMAIGGAYQLKDGTMADAIQCALWSVGAEIGADKLATVAPKISLTEEPHFNIELGDNVSADNKEFFEAFKCWCETLSGATENIKSCTENLQAVSTEASELAGTAKDECSSAGLGAMDIVKAVSAIGANSKTLASGVTKMGQLGPLAQEALADMKTIGEKLAGIMKDAPKNAEEGKGKGAATAVDMCAKQHPGEKLPDSAGKKEAALVNYQKNKAAGKKLPTPGSKGGAAKPEDVKPEVTES